MSTKLAVLKDGKTNETRAAASPETVKKLVSLGCTVTIEADAGKKAGFTNKAYEEAGAVIAKTSAFLKDADIVLSVNAPASVRLKSFKKGATLIAMLNPYDDQKALDIYAKAGIETMSMELMPRITRAQSMDVLSSQSNLAGYKAVLDATTEFGRALPMMMTAAGTIAPAKVFVMGAGVAGLQAIATAKRLGAIVSATDVRAAAGEQVESLGASFVIVEADEGDTGETDGGYAKEMSEDYQKRQAELVAQHIAKQDIVICTALIPGRPAPELVSKEMVTSMSPGSVIVDLAVERGGNCPLSKLGKIVIANGVKIVGYDNVPGRLPANASELYARNLYNFVEAFFDREGKKAVFDRNDEIIQG
ncbi:MAG TPA: Re/Si-specific NAD(P)(+) transhydrogenase subunit alpha, partial [Rhodobiaceae bacterium]|nr:Re/Si-specific NAD(P)(+) transhydrogenase subunit alpha [Rhodobiaceae bacterium]